MAVRDQDAERAQALATLQRLRGDGGGVFDSAAAGAVPPAVPADTADPAEIWGRRIGRGLAVVAGAVLVWHLVVTYLR